MSGPILNKIFIAGIHYDIQPDGCWYWKGFLAKNYGYTDYYIGTKRYKTTIHRYTHCQKFSLNIHLDSRHADHINCPRYCMNPDHIQMLTIKENVLKGNGITAQNLRLTCCRTCKGSLKLRKRKNRPDSRYCPICQYKKQRGY